MILVVAWDVSRCVMCSSSHHTFMWSMWFMKQAVYSPALVVISLYWRGWPMLCGWESVCFGVLLMCWVGEADKTKSMAKVKNKTEKEKHCDEANKKTWKNPTRSSRRVVWNLMSVQGERYQIGGEESEMSASAGDMPHVPTSLSLSFSESLCNEGV